ncbi:MAG: hypothetical protein IPN36_10730 [Bacteroidetes bacterium]|nr:hypothetical protein [Bacteroidota bacterium]
MQWLLPLPAILYICGSSSGYAGPSTRKSDLTFIGAGFNVVKQFANNSVIGSDFAIGNNNRCIGIYFQTSIVYVSNNPSLYFSRCRTIGPLYGLGLYAHIGSLEVDQCISLSGFLNSASMSSCIIRNTLFFSENGNRPFTSLSYVTSMLVDHCTFINRNFSAIELFYGLLPWTLGITISNCVFWNVTPTLFALTTYLNNYSSIAGLNTYGSGNILSSDWPFVSTQAAVNTTFSYGYDLNVLGTSSAKNAANDGTDMGMYGGLNPYYASGEPPIPQMDSMQVMGTQFSPGGNMNVKFYSVKGKP